MEMIWDASTIVNLSSIAMIVAGLFTFISTLFITAPYGRFAASTGWGPLIDARTAWFIMESPNLWITFLIWVLYPTSSSSSLSGINTANISNPATLVLLCCFLCHYINRSVIFPLQMKAEATNPMPLSVMMFAFFYCSWNGLTQSLSLLVATPYPENWITDIRFIVGVSLFWLGLAINIQSDSILFRLRSSTDNNKGEQGSSKSDNSANKKQYKIPYGGAFEYVSVANYFGEIVEWTGFAIACWSISGLAFAIFTACNLIPRALKYHQWYLQKFEEYPKGRKAVIPFVL